MQRTRCGAGELQRQGEGVGRNYTDKGSLICSPGKSVIFFTKLTPLTFDWLQPLHVEKAEMTPQKWNARNNTIFWLSFDALLYAMVCLALTVSLKKITIEPYNWLLKILTNHVSGRNNKTNHIICKSMKNWTRKRCFFVWSIWFQITLTFGKIWCIYCSLKGEVDLSERRCPPLFVTSH